MTDINYELYKVFYFVAKTLSFSEASKELFISQSAVSQSIKLFEKRLHQTLFLRSTKKVRLTSEGELLFKHIEPAVNLISRGEAQMTKAHSLDGGQLRIGASDTICRYFLVPFFEHFHCLYPGVHLRVTNATSLNCVDLLENDQVDLAPAIELSSNDLLIDLAKIGLGIAFVPDYCLEHTDPCLIKIKTQELLPIATVSRCQKLPSIFWTA